MALLPQPTTVTTIRPTGLFANLRMADFRSLIVIVNEYCVYDPQPRSVAWKAKWAPLMTVALTKLFHVMAGLYM
jgi:hypothetical protein